MPTEHPFVVPGAAEIDCDDGPDCRGATDLEDQLVRNAVHALCHGFSTTSYLGLPDNADDLDVRARSMT